MRHLALRFVTLGASALILGSAPSALGQANRVFASARSGNDLNTCSSIATPCQTLQGAVNQVAAGGAVLILDSGGYGPVMIQKAVTIEAPAGIEAFIHPPPTPGIFNAGIRVMAGSSDVVVLRGLTISGGTDAGIFCGSGNSVHVEKCVISGSYRGIDVVRGTNGPFDVYVEDTVVRNCGSDGIDLVATTGLVRATIERSHLVESVGNGVRCENGSQIVIRESLAAGNHVGYSLDLSSGSGVLAIDRSTATNNLLRGAQSSATSGSGTLWISDSVVTGNGDSSSSQYCGLAQQGTALLLSRVNNTVEGNSIDTIGTIGTYPPR